MAARKKKPDDVALGRRIAAARKAAGLTQAEASEAISLHEESLRAIELGKRGPSREVLERIAKLLRVPRTRLLGDDDDGGLTGIALEAAQIVSDLPPSWQVLALDMLRGMRERTVSLGPLPPLASKVKRRAKPRTQR